METATSTAQVLELFERWGGDPYDEVVTQTEHAVQCAVLARDEGASDEMVAAALLHDVGHLLVLAQREGVATLDRDDDHEELAVAWLADLFPATVTEPIRLHVAAKRYLCAVEPGYHAELSPASQRSLQLQGGVMADDEVVAFTRLPGALDAVALRRWDDRAKVPGSTPAAPESFRELLDRVARALG